MEEVLARHRKELKDLQGRVTQKKKQASKKTRKGVNEECDRLETELKEKHDAELSSFHAVEQGDDTAVIESQFDEVHLDGEDKTAAKLKDDATLDEVTVVPSQVRKPNRQKARLARRAAEQGEIARQAEEEAESLPDMKQQERDRMLQYMKERGLQEKEIRADGHCLYSAVADQLMQIGVSIHSNGQSETSLPYKSTRSAAAEYITAHEDEFSGFLEEPIEQYTHKIRDTAEWGGQLELQALAKVYKVEINVLQDFGRVEKITPDDTVTEDKSIWLGYYKHGFGLGEHYNSLRKAT